MASDCAEVARDHEASVANRAEEMKALASAKQAIQDMSGSAAAVVYNSAFFLQLDGSKTGSSLQTRADLANFEVVNLIRKLAKAQKSTALMQLAGGISAL